MKKLTAYLRLMRPANMVTSVADVLAGITISGFLTPFVCNANHMLSVIGLCAGTAGLYGGGIVFNDVFDASLDAVERPERPIPSGLVSLRQAILLGIFLLLAGIMASLLVNPVSGLIAFSIALAALVYDKWGKHQSFLGPLNMGLCRGLNLLLGVSIQTTALSSCWFLAFIPVIYIASITMVSRGEVHGGGRPLLYTASIFYLLVMGSILYFAWTKQTLLFTFIFLLLFGWMIFRPLFSAIRQPSGKNIGKAVKAGVIALIVMDASWAAAFGSTVLALLIVLLLPVSLWLSGLFAVT
ncbi:MAG: UbiA-like protein EboC [Bacteroidota bacterium]|nr:UbiA-like protein EboC [Bacteroidota bacterium]